MWLDHSLLKKLINGKICQPQLIRSHGYSVEEHEVTTSDGYNLVLHRIPNAGPPVFLGHCLVGSSAIWAFGPRNNSLAYMLADAGRPILFGCFLSI